MTAPAWPVRLASGDGRVVLGAYSDADVAVLTEAFADPLIARWNPGPADGDVDAWRTARNDWSAGDHASWAIRSADDSLAGSVSVFTIDHDQRDAEVGYFVLPAYRGRGIAVTAVGLAVTYVFTTLALHRLQLFHAVDNLASCRVATKTGFALEGVLRESHRYADGDYHDEHLHALLAPRVG